MARWIVENTRLGAEIGRYSAETRQGALEAMARDTGYRSYADACAAEPALAVVLRVTKIRGTR